MYCKQSSLSTAKNLLRKLLIICFTLSSLSLPLLVEGLRGSGDADFISPTKADNTTSQLMAETYGKLPLSFELNQGQTDSRVKFISRGKGYALFLTPTETVMTLQDVASDHRDASLISDNTKTAVLRMALVGANSSPEIEGLDELAGKNNYFIGNDPEKWRNNIRTFSKVNYQQVYPGIDMIYYGNQQQLEYDFIVAPGANPEDIRIALDGTDKVSTDSVGDLILETSAGTVRQHKPVVYQDEAGVRKLVACNYLLNEQGEIGFDIGSYDPTKPLVIDPVLSYSTFLGGEGQDAPEGMAVDSQGNVYLAGWTFSEDFPLTGTFTPERGAFITKLDNAGKELIYSTFVGGTQSADIASGIAVDSQGNVFVTGYTTAPDFPVTPNAFQRQFRSQFRSAFVTKLNPTGTELVYSTYIGGNEADQAWAIAIDSAGNAYITGSSYVLVDFLAEFPITDGAFQPTYKGGFDRFGGDAFVTKLNASGTGLEYSTYLGSSHDDSAVSIAVDSAGSAYVVGGANEGDFPTTPGSYQPTSQGFGASFVTKLSPDGKALSYSTYLRNAQITNVVVDSGGNAYVTGTALVDDFKITPGAYQSTPRGGIESFVAKINPSGADLVYSTFIGGTDDDFSKAIALDSGGNVYLIGETWSNDFPATPDAHQPNLTDTWPDIFFTKLNATGTAIIYSTYLGGVSPDRASDIVIDQSGNAYLTGEAGSADFPTTPGVFDREFGDSHTEGFIVKFSGLSPFDICLQDENNGNMLRLNSTTGSYEFVNCQTGLTLTGTGKVTKGAAVKLKHKASDRNVTANFKSKPKKGSASIRVNSAGSTFTIKDKNTTNNTCSCP